MGTGLLTLLDFHKNSLSALFFYKGTSLKDVYTKSRKIDPLVRKKVRTGSTSIVRADTP